MTILAGETHTLIHVLWLVGLWGQNKGRGSERVTRKGVGRGSDERLRHQPEAVVVNQSIILTHGRSIDALVAEIHSSEVHYAVCVEIAVNNVDIVPLTCSDRGRERRSHVPHSHT